LSHFEATEVGRSHFIFLHSSKKICFYLYPKFFINVDSSEIIILAFRSYHVRSKRLMLARFFFRVLYRDISVSVIGAPSFDCNALKFYPISSFVLSGGDSCSVFNPFITFNPRMLLYPISIYSRCNKLNHDQSNLEVIIRIFHICTCVFRFYNILQ